MFIRSGCLLRRLERRRAEGGSLEDCLDTLDGETEGLEGLGSSMFVLFGEMSISKRTLGSKLAASADPADDPSAAEGFPFVSTVEFSLKVDVGDGELLERVEEPTEVGIGGRPEGDEVGSSVVDTIGVLGLADANRSSISEVEASCWRAPILSLIHI